MIRVADNSKTRISIVIVLTFILFIPKSVEESAIINASVIPSLEIETSILKDGDLIFRRGISFVSNLVLETDPNSPYSHIGIISFYNSTPYVIHAVPDESENGIDYIRKDSIEIFLLKDRASAYEVIRFHDSFIAAKASNFAKISYEAGILFDDSFSLLDSTKYYCTELIWRAYKYAGVDLIANKFDTLSIPIGENPFILPGTLLRSPNTIQIIKKSLFQREQNETLN